MLRKERSRRFRLSRRLVHSVVRHIIPHYDPIVNRQVHGTELRLHLSHSLPRLVESRPFYDTALPSFAKFVLGQKQPPEKLMVVDVGANIGDTTKLIAAATGSNRARFICVEADVCQYSDRIRKGWM